MRSKSSGNVTSATFASNQASTPPRSIPSGACWGIGREAYAASVPERDRAARPHTALLMDFGGVLTTNRGEGFDEFCRGEGIEEGAVRRLFKHDPEALADLRLLETGEIEPA